MKIWKPFLISLLLIAIANLVAGMDQSLNWRQEDALLALFNKGKIVWQINYQRQQGNPCFSPLGLMDGTNLTWYRPPDHVWHYAFWFAWKYINGLNYWDDQKEPGKWEGLTEIQAVKVEPRSDFSSRIEFQLSYHPPQKLEVMSECRILEISAPASDGSYFIDWTSRLNAGEEKIVFQRTPILGQKDGVSYGGYAGLSLRLTRDLRDWIVTNSNGDVGMQGHGKPARWVDFSGTLPGGRKAGIAIYDHSENPRHPTPWFLAMDPKSPFGYFNPALLFQEPLELQSHQRMQLRYRVLVHEGIVGREKLDSIWASFTNPNSGKENP